MARRRYIRRGASKADGGASWISYSDMMAALLLVFVLVLCYSVYQYFLMLETKTAELDEQSRAAYAAAGYAGRSARGTLRAAGRFNRQTK